MAKTLSNFQNHNSLLYVEFVKFENYATERKNTKPAFVVQLQRRVIPLFPSQSKGVQRVGKGEQEQQCCLLGWYLIVSDLLSGSHTHPIFLHRRKLTLIIPPLIAIMPFACYPINTHPSYPGSQSTEKLWPCSLDAQSAHIQQHSRFKLSLYLYFSNILKGVCRSQKHSFKISVSSLLHFPHQPQLLQHLSYCKTHTKNVSN